MQARRAAFTALLLGAAALGGAWLSGTALRADPPASPAPRAVTLPALPLKTSGRWIVDGQNARFKLAGVNWYGAEEADHVPAGLEYQPVDAIARRIAELGFNVVRLPWSNELVENNPVIEDANLAANPALKGKHALEVLDAVVDALGKAGVLVVLDNHTSRGDWCCSDSDGNGLWHADHYPESAWLADWRTMALRYRDRRHVIGADLRNELRSGATWGGGGPTDWRAAAERGGRTVLAVASHWLIFVEGPHYATELHGAFSQPISFPGRLVWEAHEYSWSQPDPATFDALHTVLGDAWGFLLIQNRPFTAPVWVGEFGTSHDAAGTDPGRPGGRWFGWCCRYLREADIDWCYWAINGTQARGKGRSRGAEESYGILDRDWNTVASAELMQALTGLQPATQGPTGDSLWKRSLHLLGVRSN